MLGIQLAPRYTEGIQDLLFPNSLTCFMMKFFLSMVITSHILLSSLENGCVLSITHVSSILLANHTGRICGILTVVIHNAWLMADPGKMVSQSSH